MESRSILRIAFGTALLLLVPLVAMLLTDEVNWSPADFVVAGFLLFGTGLAYERVARKGGSTAYRAATAVTMVTALLLIWMNLAVGLIGDEENPANLMYVGVLGVGLLGVYLSRFRPGGMARALFATAGAQVAVGVIAWVAGLGFTLIVNGFFAVLWMAAGLLYRRAEGVGAVWQEEAAELGESPHH